MINLESEWKGKKMVEEDTYVKRIRKRGKNKGIV